MIMENQPNKIEHSIVENVNSKLPKTKYTLLFSLLVASSLHVVQASKTVETPVKTYKIAISDNLTQNYIGYDYNHNLYTFVSGLFTKDLSYLQKPNSQNVISTNGDSWKEKDYYRIYNDSMAITYRFDLDNPEHANKHKEMSKKIYAGKLKIEDFEKSGVNFKSLAYDRASNVSMSTYLLTVKEGKVDLDDLLKIGSSIFENSETYNKEIDSMRSKKIFNKKGSYEKVRVAFTPKKDSIVIRMLVSEKQDQMTTDKRFKITETK